MILDRDGFIDCNPAVRIQESQQTVTSDRPLLKAVFHLSGFTEGWTVAPHFLPKCC